MARRVDVDAGMAVEQGAYHPGLSQLLENRHVLGVLFVLPVVFLLGVFLAYPFLLGLWLSFTDTLIGAKGHFVGLRNYLNVLGDPMFRLVTFNTFLYTTVAVVFKLVLGLILALVLNREFRFKGLIRAIVLLPWIVPTVLSAISFWWMYDSSFSVITWVLKGAGLVSRPIDFLGEPNLARVSVIIANIWRGVPFFAIGLLAGLQTISPSLYEAAQIDGAGGWKRFRYITLPLLTPLVIVVTVFSTIWTFSDFQLVWVITKGGPVNATHLYGTWAYQRAIQGGMFGEGAAISNFIFPVLLVCVIVSFLYLRKEE